MALEAPDDKTCIKCQYLCLWEHECVHPCSKKCYQYVYDDEKACEWFEPEVINGKKR